MAGIDSPHFRQASTFVEVAQRDATALAGMLNANVFADEIFGFHAQQAVEKSLKAWLSALGQTYPSSHDLGRLLVILQTFGVEVDAYWWAEEFTVYALQARYESGYLDADAPLNRQLVLSNVQHLLRKVESVVLCRTP